MKDVIAYATKALDGDLNKIRTALDGLSSEQVWHRWRESTNSIGNLCLHLAGAEFQRMSSAIGGQPVVRERSLEFTTQEGYSPQQLLSRLEKVRADSKTVMQQLSEKDLVREIRVYFKEDDWKRMFADRPEHNQTPAYQAETVETIILGLVSHYSYHTGQIVLLSKLERAGEEQILRWKH
jgi:hypothetical protein